MRSRTNAALAAASAAALLLAGCAQTAEEDETEVAITEEGVVAVEDWVADICGAFQTLEEATSDLGGEEDAATAFGDAIVEAQEGITTAGQLDVEGGAEISAALTEALEAIRTASEVDPTDEEAAAALEEQFAETEAALQAADEAIAGSPELQEAIEAEPLCEGVDLGEWAAGGEG